MKMRSLGISAISILMTGAVIGNAYFQKKQFYPSVVYITKSNASMAVIYVQFFVIVLMLGKLLRKIFLGTLRAAEFEHLMERFWYALTETCLAFTVFRDDFNPRFVALFTVLLFLKSFHWLAEERVDYMERSPVIGWLFHVRVASLLSVLSLLDYFMIMHAYNSTISKGPTVQLVFGFEYAILITMVANTTIKYILHAAEMRADTPWENKAVFLLYTELVIGLIKVILYFLFVVIMARIYALPMFVFRPMFYTIRNFKKALNDVIMSRRAIRNMNTLYPDATQEELEMSDNICIICREDMVSNSKKLPCGHIFHTACLRSWFQRQQTCPTCRLNILRTAHNSTTVPRPDIPNAGGNLNQNNAGGPQPGFNVNINNNNNNNNIPNDNPFTSLFSQMGPGGGINSFPNATAVPLVFPPPPPSLSPFPFVTPYAIPPPPMPPGLDTLTDDEIRALEGTERRHVEERIKLLRNIQLMLDASVALMNQYSAIAARLPQFPAPNFQPTSANVTLQSSGLQPSSEPGTSSSQNAATPTTGVVNKEQPTASGTSSAASSAATSAFKPELIPVGTAGGNNKNQDTNKDQKNQNDNDSITSNTQGIKNDQLKTSDIHNSSNRENKIHIEDIGSEENYGDVNDIDNNEASGGYDIDVMPGTSTEIIDNNNYSSSELSEIRRRRLQKFLQQERNDNVTN